jgi:FkbM family methyltransferase
MTIKHQIRKFTNKLGLDVSRFPEGNLKNRLLALKYFHIDTIIDVGANDGGYAKELRELKYNGRIISFEPIKSVFEELRKTAKNDPQWFVENMALGESDRKDFINISMNTVSSSMLDMLDKHEDSSPESRFISKEEITIRKLDSIFLNYYKEGNNVLLKIDTQGYEKFVLDGAIDSLPNIRGIQMEMSLVPLYEGTPLFVEMVKSLDNLGFQLYLIESGFTNQTSGQLLQVDGTFYRKDIL